MKLRNKKTGEVAEPFGIACINGRTFVRFDDGKGTFKFEARSLTELNEEWEDYEKPKTVWYMNWEGNICCADFEADWSSEKSIGNYFETREEAEKAKEKLKAWKRLKDRGFRFNKQISKFDNEKDRWHFLISASCKEWDGNIEADLDLLFGGEE